MGILGFLGKFWIFRILGEIWEFWEFLGKFGNFGNFGEIWEFWEFLRTLAGKVCVLFFEKIVDLSKEICLCQRQMDLLAEIVTIGGFGRLNMAFVTDSGKKCSVGEKNDRR